MAVDFSKQHEVTFYECDVNGTMTFPAMLGVIIKVSEEQSVLLKRGAVYIRSFGLTWVITNYQMTIKCLPKVGEEITVTTCAQSYNKYFCYRDFMIMNQEGEELVKIESVFVLMDVHNRKISSVPEEIIAPFESEKIKKIKRIPKIPSIVQGETLKYRVRFYDIDSNHHVNNAMYFNWIIDVLGYDFLTTHVPAAVNIHFDKEVAYGSEVDSQYEIITHENYLSSIHAIKIGEQICAAAEIQWELK